MTKYRIRCKFLFLMLCITVTVFPLVQGHPGCDKIKLETEKRFVPENAPYQIIASVCEDDSGNVFVLDSKAFKIYKFSGNGKQLKSFGHRGQGPADFVQPHSVYWDKNRLIVNEARDWISIFDKNGTFIQRLKIQKGLGLFYINTDLLYAWIWTSKGRKQVFIKKNGEVMDSFYSMPKSRFSVSVPDETGRHVMFSHFSETYCPYFLFSIQNGVSALAVSDKYEIVVQKGNSKNKTVIKRKITPQTISNAERTLLENEINENAKFPETVKKKLKKIIPSHKNYFSQLLVSNRYIWAFRVKKHAVTEQSNMEPYPVEVDLFTHNGEFKGTKKIKDTPYLVTNRYMYFVQDDEEDTMHLVRYNYILKH